MGNVQGAPESAEQKTLQQLDEFLVKRSHIVLGPQIGQGSFGLVYSGMLNGQKIAVKTLHQSFLSGSVTESLLLTAHRSLVDAFAQEVLTMGKLKHTNVIRLIGACVPPDPLCIIIEYLQKGSLDQLLFNPNEIIDRDRLYRFALDIARGMECLHSISLIHSDLKPQNILVSGDDICKVGDFGLSRFVQINATSVSNKSSGTPGFTAPEVFKGERLSQKVDIYSFAVTMWSMHSRVLPFQGWQLHHLIFSVVSRNKRPDIPNLCEYEYGLLMKQCWSGNPAKRPCFEEVVKRLVEISSAPAGIDWITGLRASHPNVAFDLLSSSPSVILKWNNDDVCAWLTLVGFEMCCGNFAENDIDGATLVKLNEVNLRDDLGIVVLGQRKKLMKQIDALRDSLAFREEPCSPEVEETDSELEISHRHQASYDSCYVPSDINIDENTLLNDETSKSLDVVPRRIWSRNSTIMQVFTIMMEANRLASVYPADLRFGIYTAAVAAIDEFISSSIKNSDPLADFDDTLDLFSASLDEHQTAFLAKLKDNLSDAEKGEMLCVMFQSILSIHGGLNVTP